MMVANSKQSKAVNPFNKKPGEKPNGAKSLMLVLFLFFLAEFNFLSRVSWDIKDDVFDSYIISVLLSLPFFALFSFKRKRKIEKRKLKEKNPKAKSLMLKVLLSSIILAASFAVNWALKVNFYELFTLFRMDFLRISFYSAIFSLFFFGYINLELVVFSLMASPILFSPVYWFSKDFNLFNVWIISPLLPKLGITAEENFLIKGNKAIQISEACTSPSIFVSFFVFSVLISRFFDGALGKKALYIIYGISLLFAANILRLIAMVYFFSIGSTLHISGVPFFYAVLIIFVFSFKIFGLKLPTFEVAAPSPKEQIVLTIFTLFFFLLSLS